MENANTNLGKDDQNDEMSVECAGGNKESANPNLLCRKGIRKIKPDHTLLFNLRRSRNCNEKIFLQNVHGLRGKIPKHIISLEENYILHCLETIRTYAMRAAAQSLASKMDTLRLDTHFPLVVGTENIDVNSSDWIIGMVTGSTSMMNILKSPLLNQFGMSDGDVQYERSVIDISRPICSDSAKSSSSVYKMQREVTVVDHGYGSQYEHKRHLSISSTNSTYSDQTSSSVSSTMYQGMLQIIWKDRLPHHVFSIDEKEVYVASLSKPESPEDKVLDYVYMFHSSKKGHKEGDNHDLELVGKMRVSTSITLCPNNSEIRETHFVLYGSNGNPVLEKHVANDAFGKNKRMTRKVVKAFRSRQRSSSKFGGSSAILEDASWDPPRELQNILDPDDQYVPSLELAAIVVKDHVCNNRKETGIGGWGLKFLRKSGNNQSPETSILTELCPRDSGECSTSTNILVPAGFHGGPRAGVGGPSTLIERWVLGGSCDCGGWDIGCPLTVLNAISSSKENDSEECKSYDFVIQGSKQSTPMMKMVNIHDSLHYIHFQSSLSALQSFAIAAAVIHSRSPVLRSKVYRS